MRTLLIIEDEIIIAQAVQNYMEQNDFTVKIATNADLAMQFLKELSFHAVICDINLQEEKTGIDIIQQYHRSERHGPVVFLTAYSSSDIMQSAESLLPYAYIIKPFHNKQLLTTLNLAIANSQSAISDKDAISPELKKRLSKREKDILAQLVFGKTNKEIGESLFISKHTVDTHIRNIKEKLGLHKKGELIKFVLTNQEI